MQIRLMPRRLIGQTIRGIRNRLGMSQADFAKALGVESGATVARWEKGQTQPEYGTLAKIATMGVVDVLVFHETPEGAPSPQLTPGEAVVLREIITRIEAQLAEAKALLARAENRTAVEVLEAATGSTPTPAPETDATVVVDAEVRLETRPRTRSRTASAGRAKPSTSRAKTKS
ncbi:MAG: helix-turn-helix transcriptional regulator [Longimicrobiaceae bacterium]